MQTCCKPALTVSGDSSGFQSISLKQYYIVIYILVTLLVHEIGTWSTAEVKSGIACLLSSGVAAVFILISKNTGWNLLPEDRELVFTISNTCCLGIPWRATLWEEARGCARQPEVVLVACTGGQRRGSLPFSIDPKCGRLLC